MAHPGEPRKWPLEKYRDYLLLLARVQLRASSLRAKFDESDVVQEAMVKALRNLEQFSGQTEAELTAWLREILKHCLADTVRKFAGAGRDAGRERALPEKFDVSWARLESLLRGNEPSPSHELVLKEDMVHLAAALAQLPEDNRTAIELRHLHGLSVAAVAAEMGKTEQAVGGLLRRGMKQLRETLRDST